jgi:hypothetical protein
MISLRLSAYELLFNLIRVKRISESSKKISG